MKGIDNKIENLIHVINNCSPEGYFHYKFQEFCSSMMSDGDEISPYLEEQGLADILVKVREAIPGESEDVIARTLYFSFGIFCFKSYVKYCLEVACIVKRGMVIFCKYIEKNYLTDNLVNRMHELYLYFNRSGNKDMEQEHIKITADAFYFLKSVGNMGMPIGTVDDSEDEVRANGERIGYAFACYVDALILCCANLFNFLDTMSLLFSEV